MLKKVLATYLLTGLILIFCKGSLAKQNQAHEKTTAKTGAFLYEDSIVYKTKNLIIRRLSDHVYEHKSFLKTKDIGNVDCNGMLVINPDL